MSFLEKKVTELENDSLTNGDLKSKLKQENTQLVHRSGQTGQRRGPWAEALGEGWGAGNPHVLPALSVCECQPLAAVHPDGQVSGDREKGQNLTSLPPPGLQSQHRAEARIGTHLLSLYPAAVRA